MFKKHFDSYVCEGDSITCEVDGIEFTARLVFDSDSSPMDYECYSARQIKAWRRDEWHYFGVVISAKIEDVDLGKHLASLWRLEGNFPATNRKNPNAYFLEVANNLLPEAIEQATARIEKIHQVTERKLAA